MPERSMPGEEEECFLLPEPTSLDVRLFHWTGSVAPAYIAARLCYKKDGYAGVEEELTRLRQRLSPPEVEDYMSNWLADKIVARNHMGIFEHIDFHFAVRGISRAASHQLVRHRVASYAQQSQRYVDKGNFRYIIPGSIAAIPDARDAFTATMNSLAIAYQRLQRHMRTAYPTADAEFVNQDCRFVLPNACETEIVIKMNARALIEAGRQRLCSHAQWEVRAMFEEIRTQAVVAMPLLRDIFVPACRRCQSPCNAPRTSILTR